MNLVEALRDERISHLDLSGSVQVSGAPTVAEVLAAMREERASAALIVGEGGRLEGIFTERDVLLKVADDPTRLAVPVRELRRAVSPSSRCRNSARG